MEVPCYRCQKPAALDTKQRRDSFNRNGRSFCSGLCRDVTRSSESSALMAATNRRYASERMRTRNPMRLKSARDRMSASLRAIGHGPRIRGGNGRSAPAPQMALASALGWPMEVVVVTGLRGKTPERYPTHYKIDIAHRDLLIAVEVDGSSHHGMRSVLDVKKDRFLKSHGWTVLRFSNDDVLADVEACARAVRAFAS